LGARGFFPEGKVARAWSWPLMSIKCWGLECVELSLHSPRCLCGAMLS
jgi:hypothetical protein